MLFIINIPFIYLYKHLYSDRFVRRDIIFIYVIICILSTVANDTLSQTTGQLPQVGSDIGNFLANLAPGVVAFVFILAIVGGIIALFGAVVFVVKNAMSKKK